MRARTLLKASLTWAKTKFSYLSISVRERGFLKNKIQEFLKQNDLWGWGYHFQHKPCWGNRLFLTQKWSILETKLELNIEQSHH